MDDLVLSGLALYRATQNQTYLDQSLAIYKSTAGLNYHTEPLDWDNKVKCKHLFVCKSIILFIIKLIYYHDSGVHYMFYSQRSCLTIQIKTKHFREESTRKII
jgi:hypothetical protein